MEKHIKVALNSENVVIGFYPSDINYSDLPENLIEITPEKHEEIYKIGKPLKWNGSDFEIIPDKPLDYRQKRIAEYPSIRDQLDKIYHEGLDAWKAQILEIKNKYPKE